MRLLPWSKLTIVATCLTTCISTTAAKDARTVISGMDDLRRSVDEARTVFDSYDGGVLPSLALGKAVWDVYFQTKQARTNWDATMLFTEEEIPDVLSSYHALRTSIADTIHKAGSKGPAYEKAGFKLLALGMMQLFENERSAFQESAKLKIPPSYHDNIAGPVASLKKEFQVSMQALA